MNNTPQTTQDSENIEIGRLVVFVRDAMLHHPGSWITRSERQIAAYVLKKQIEEASHYCDEGHFHDKDRDLAMLPSERIAELKAQLSTLTGEKYDNYRTR